MSTLSRRSFVQAISAATLAPGMFLASAEAGTSESSALPKGAGANYADYKHIQVSKDRHGVATVTLNP